MRRNRKEKKITGSRPSQRNMHSSSHQCLLQLSDLHFLRNRRRKEIEEEEGGGGRRKWKKRKKNRK
jgi:hypothetical protein